MGSRGGKRSRLAFSLALPSAVAVALLVTAAFATAAGDSPGPLPSPFGFHLRSSNGYVISALGAGGQGGPQVVFVIVSKPGSAVLYETSATLGEDTIEASLGGVGRIDVHYVPSGGIDTQRSKCGGKPVSFLAGHYEGTIDFAGEDGYSAVEARSAVGDIRPALNLLCPGGPAVEGVGGHSPGARLRARHGGSARFVFEAQTNSHTRPAHFSASISERHGRVAISRSVSATGPSSGFSFDVPAGTAEVQPPAPFTGTATFRRLQRGESAWLGDLHADFPGRPRVPLTGPGTRASLLRTVENPSHPFALPTKTEK